MPELAPSENNIIRLKGNDIAVEDIKALTALMHVSPMLGKANVRGNIKTFDMSIDNSTKQPKINLAVSPAGLILEGQNHIQILKVNDGLITINDNKVDFSKLGGLLGTGNFLVEGHIGLLANALSDLTLSAHNLDLSSGKILLQLLGLKNQLINDQLISGKIEDIKLHLIGSEQKYQLALSMTPDDIVFAPIDSTKSMHFTGGDIKYESEILTIANVSVKGAATQCKVSMKMSHCASQPVLEDINIDNATIDLREISACFTAVKNPPYLRRPFKKLLDTYDISDIQGNLTGNLLAKNLSNKAEVVVDCVLQAVRFKRSGQTISILNGSLSTDKNNELNLRGINCAINKSMLTINGHFSNFHGIQDLQPHLKLEGQVYCQDLSPFFAASPVIFYNEKANQIGSIFIQ